jgi:hypothetical protein
MDATQPVWAPKSYEHINGSLFRFKLRAPVFELVD